MKKLRPIALLLLVLASAALTLGADRAVEAIPLMGLELPPLDVQAVLVIGNGLLALLGLSLFLFRQPQSEVLPPRQWKPPPEVQQPTLWPGADAKPRPTPQRSPEPPTLDAVVLSVPQGAGVPQLRTDPTPTVRELPEMPIPASPMPAPAAPPPAGNTAAPPPAASSTGTAVVAVKPPPPPAAQMQPPKRLRMEAEDREFLPAALEILETPPSPIRIALMVAICSGFTAALVWSWFGHLEIHAVAQGKVQPQGRSKVVQPLEPGRIVAIHVENGARVAAGDAVADLDPTETVADEASTKRDLEAMAGEMARRTTAIRLAVAMPSGAAQPSIEGVAFPDGIDVGVRQREQRVLEAELGQLFSSMETLRAQRSEKLAQGERLYMSIKARQHLMTLMQERVDIRQSIEDKQQGYRARVIDALQELERERTTLAGEQGQLIETQAGMIALERRISGTRAEFVADQTQKLAEAERKHDRLTQDLVKARSKATRTRLTAPIGGTVQQLAVTTIGQVVTSGQALMTIVPTDTPIEIEAMILNQDVGFVEAGQVAVVKVEAFPFTRYGTIEGSVVKVSREAVDEREATGLADAAGTTRPQGGLAGQAPRGQQSLVFPAIISLSRTTLNIDGKDVALTPGMTVTIEVQTGQRRVIDYLLSPIIEVRSKAGRER